MGYEKYKEQGLYSPNFEHDSCGVGFVVNIKGQKSHSIVEQGLTVLKRLAHRGAVGADPDTGDGAGILIQIPHDFYAKVFAKLPRAGSYGTGLVFLPQNKRLRSICKVVFAKVVEEEGQVFLGWRKVPVDKEAIGKTAQDSQPVIEQAFIAKGKKGLFNNRL